MRRMFCLILLFGLLHCLNAQTYLIIEYQADYKFSVHNERSRLWIIENPTESVMQKISPLFLTGYSVGDVESCKESQSVDPFIQTKESSCNFDKSHYASIETIKDLVTENRKLLQTMVIKWKSGQRVKIKVYATPITGEFCSTVFTDYRQEMTNHYGNIYFPIGAFSYDHFFWESTKGKELINWDFWKIEFDKIN